LEPLFHPLGSNPPISPKKIVPWLGLKILGLTDIWEVSG